MQPHRLDGESEYSVLRIKEENREVEKVKIWKSKMLPQAIKFFNVILRTTGSIFSATVDTGGPASFLNQRTSDLVLKEDKSAIVLSLDEYPIKTKYVDYNHHSNKLFGTIVIKIHSNGWVAENVHFLISDNRTRWLLGLDIQAKIGLMTTQVKPKYSQVKEIEGAENEESEESELWKKKFMEKHKTCSIDSEGLRITKFSNFSICR